MNENGPRLGHGPSAGHHVAVGVLHFLLGAFRRALHLLAAALDILAGARHGVATRDQQHASEGKQCV
ncbi:hypothetical protein CBM2626_B130243 [Cupriavidus taiwanensis]|nr:hypothetical protein CBM2626_B130243 [Cupriavidus taiwanensis]